MKPKRRDNRYGTVGEINETDCWMDTGVCSVNDERWMRTGIASAGVVVPFLVILALVLQFSVLGYCHLEGDCDIFGGESTDEKIDQQEKNAKAAGMARQMFYGVTVGEQDMILLEALRLYAYCERLPDEDADTGRCADAPGEDAIVESIEQFRPYPRKLTNVIKEVIPFLDGIAFVVSAERDGVELVAAGHNTGDVGGRDTSTFVVVEPLPGGQHLRVLFRVNVGRTTMGVIEQ